MPSTNSDLRKLVIEVRYEPQLTFYGKMDNLAARLRDRWQFPDWRRSPLTVEVYNRVLHERVFLAHNRLFFESTPNRDRLASLFDHANDLIAEAVSSFGIETIQRLGVRQWFAIDSGQSFAFLRDVSRDQLVAGTATNLACGNDANMDDVAFVFEGCHSAGWDYHMRFGPMEQKQWFEFVKYEKFLYHSPSEAEGDSEDGQQRETIRDIEDSIPLSFTYLDMDCYKEDFPASGIREQVSESRRCANDRAQSLEQFFRSAK